jgi:hypothetical protein
VVPFVRSSGATLARAALVALLLLVPGAMRAQGPSADVQKAMAATTPAAFAEAFLSLFAHGEFEQSAQLMHPDALSPVRRIVSLIVKQDPSGEVRSQLLGVSTDSAVAALTDAQVFAKFLTQVFAQQEGVLETMKGSTVAVLGVVAEGADTAHVVWRSGMTMQGLSISKMEVLSVRRAGTGWRAMLTGDFENFIKGMELGMTQRAARP